MSIQKRNYEKGTSETVVDEPCGVIAFNQWQNFVLEDYFRFEFSDIVLKADGVVVSVADYVLALDEVYTAKEAAVGGTGKILYAKFKVINAALDGKSLTVSGLNFGTMVDNEEMKRYVDDSLSAVVRNVVEISSDTAAVNNTTYLVDTSAAPGTVTVLLPSTLQSGFNVGVYKISSIEAPEVRVDGNGIDIGSSPTQEIVGESEGISIIADGKYFINQDNRGGLQRKLSQSTGVLSGFVITPNVDPSKIDIGPGIFEIEDASDMLNVVSQTVQFDGVVGYTIDNLAIQGITFVFIDVDMNLTQQTNVTTSPQQWRTKARIATVQHFFGGGVIGAALPYHTPPQNPASRVSTLMNTIGIIREGVVISGAGANNLQIANTSGILVSPGSNQVLDSLNPDNVPILAADPVSAIVYLTRNNVDRVDTAVDIANYDVAGTITAIGGPSATSVIHRVYMGIDGTVAIQYGQNTYQTLQQAKDGLFSGEDVFVQNPILNKITTLLCYIIATKSATNFNDLSDALFFVTDKFGSGGTISGGGAGASTLQEAYDNSISDPEIITNATRKAFDIRNGSGADANSVFTVQDIAGTKVLDVKGDEIVVNDVDLESTDGDTVLTASLKDFLTGGAGYRGEKTNRGFHVGVNGFMAVYSDVANRIGGILTTAGALFKLSRLSSGGVSEQGIEYFSDGTIGIDQPTTTETSSQIWTRDGKAMVSAEALSSPLTWVNVVPSTGFTLNAGNPMQYVVGRDGNIMVKGRLDVTAGSVDSSTSIPIFTLPVGLMPSTTMWAMAQFGTTTNVVVVPVYAIISGLTSTSSLNGGGVTACSFILLEDTLIRNRD